MKAKLTFNLPEEQVEFKHALHGVDYYLALVDLDDRLRAIVKYGGTDKWKGREEQAELFREELNEVLNDRGINIHDD